MTFILLSCAVEARADSEAEQRHTAYAEGIKAAKAERWQEARRILSGLWDEQQSYDIALNLGLAEYNLKTYAAAANHLAYALRHFPAKEEAQARTRAQGMLDLAKEHIGVLEIRVDRDGATLLLDGVTLGTSPLHHEVYVEPGDHMVVARLPDYEDSSVEVKLAAKESREIELSMQPSSRAAPPPLPKFDGSPTPGAPHSNPEDGGSKPGSWGPEKTVALIAGAGATLVAVGIGIGYALSASSVEGDQNRLRAQVGGSNACVSPTASNADLCDQLKSAGESRDSRIQTGNVALLVGAVTGAATAGILLLWPNEKSERALEFSPNVGLDHTGLLVTGKF